MSLVAGFHKNLCRDPEVQIMKQICVTTSLFLHAFDLPQQLQLTEAGSAENQKCLVFGGQTCQSCMDATCNNSATVTTVLPFKM